MAKHEINSMDHDGGKQRESSTYINPAPPVMRMFFGVYVGSVNRNARGEKKADARLDQRGAIYTASIGWILLPALIVAITSLSRQNYAVSAVSESTGEDLAAKTGNNSHYESVGVNSNLSPTQRLT
jgi:hypothetical protein